MIQKSHFEIFFAYFEIYIMPYNYITYESIENSLVNISFKLYIFLLKVGIKIAIL